MPDLWIHGRRPAALVRHKHGGFNATFPMNFHTVEEQVGLFKQTEAEAAEAAKRAEATQHHQDGPEAGNVLSFQPRAARGARSGGSGDSGRHGRRPTPFNTPPARD